MHASDMESVYPIKVSKKDSRKSGCAELHHIISESRRYRRDIISFVHLNGQDPAKIVSHTESVLARYLILVSTGVYIQAEEPFAHPLAWPRL